MAITDEDFLAVSQQKTDFWRDLRKSFSAQSIFLVMAVIYFATFETAQILNHALVEKDFLWNFMTIALVSLPTAFLMMVLIQFYFVATVDKSEKPVKDLWRRMKSVFRHHDTMVRGVPMYTAILVFMYTFTVFKANITNFIPFSWDVTFDQWDKTLHFGTRPWEWLQPIFGNIVGTLILNVNYNFWFIVMKVFWVYYAFIHVGGFDRTRFLISFFFVWAIGGTMFATLLSSAGPCFYDLVVTGANPYAPLMQQLQAFNTVAPIWAVDTQTLLWQYRVEGSPMGGVTAMPSMHNATALLFVLIVWNKSKLLRNLLIAHMILIFIGSVHLGWHYAVDAYIAWALTLVCWFAAHKLALWWEARPKVQAFNAEFVENL